MKLPELISICLGHASMQWLPRPKGEFDSTKVAKIGAELVHQLLALNESHYIADVDIICYICS